MIAVLATPDSVKTREPIWLSHYGTGRTRDSPVIVTLPRVLDRDRTRILTTLEVGEAIQEAYSFCSKASEISDLQEEIGRLVRTWQRRQYLDAPSEASDLVRRLRSANLASYRDYPEATLEDKVQNKLGYLAATAEFPGTVWAGIFDHSWTDDVRIPTRNRIIGDSLLTGAIGSAAASTALMNPASPEMGLWWLMGLFLVRFGTKLSETSHDTLFNRKAIPLFAKTARERRRAAKMLRRGATQDEIYALAAAAFTREATAAASAEAAAQIEAELTPLIEDRPERAPTLIERVGEVESPDWDLLQAQRALLQEIREAKLDG